MKNALATRMPGGKLNRSALLNTKTRMEQLGIATADLFRRLQQLPQERREEVSRAERAEMRKTYAVRKGVAEKVLINLAKQNPAVGGRVSRISKATGMRLSSVSAALSRERRRPAIDRERIKKEFWAAIRGMEGGKLAEKSMEARRRLARNFWVRVEDINAVVLMPLLSQQNLTIAEIARNTGIGRILVRDWERKLASYSSGKNGRGTAWETRGDRIKERGEEGKGIVAAAEALLLKHPKEKIENILRMLKEQGRPDPKTWHVIRARRNLIRQGLLFFIRGPLGKRVLNFLSEHPGMGSKQAFDKLSRSNPTLTYDQVSHVRNILMHEEKVTRLMGPLPKELTNFILAHPEMPTMEAQRAMEDAEGRKFKLHQVQYARRKLIKAGQVPGVNPKAIGIRRAEEAKKAAAEARPPARGGRYKPLGAAAVDLDRKAARERRQMPRLWPAAVGWRKILQDSVLQGREWGAVQNLADALAKRGELQGSPEAAVAALRTHYNDHKSFAKMPEGKSQPAKTQYKF